MSCRRDNPGWAERRRDGARCMVGLLDTEGSLDQHRLAGRRDAEPGQQRRRSQKGTDDMLWRLERIQKRYGTEAVDEMADERPCTMQVPMEMQTKMQSRTRRC